MALTGPHSKNSHHAPGWVAGPSLREVLRRNRCAVGQLDLRQVAAWPQQQLSSGQLTAYRVLSTSEHGTQKGMVLFHPAHSLLLVLPGNTAHGAPCIQVLQLVDPGGAGAWAQACKVTLCSPSKTGLFRSACRNIRQVADCWLVPSPGKDPPPSWMPGWFIKELPALC